MKTYKQLLEEILNEKFDEQLNNIKEKKLRNDVKKVINLLDISSVGVSFDTVFLLLPGFLFEKEIMALAKIKTVVSIEDKVGFNLSQAIQSNAGTGLSVEKFGLDANNKFLREITSISKAGLIIGLRV